MGTGCRHEWKAAIPDLLRVRNFRIHVLGLGELLSKTN